ncbi:hypothetical protein [Pseudonocardia alaniniphila]|uniref:Uncharacterized protein n=1 Tax=Pseudonocardia alaniniphila TaxID=75291 RepID=A0ABS9TS15_9PSEU|nr:hypothetical protein [Pseudonocardia alaniniphila]MCH6171319.1 hypothetical protein [Pseudonocardia alaniniphila]
MSGAARTVTLLDGLANTVFSPRTATLAEHPGLAQAFGAWPGAVLE